MEFVTKAYRVIQLIGRKGFCQKLAQGAKSHCECDTIDKAQKNKNTDLFTNKASKADILTEDCSVSKNHQE